MAKVAAPKKFNYGGQAVLEGVMIRGEKAAAVAVRRPNGSVIAICEPLPALYNGGLRRIPLIRGIVVLVETLNLGLRALMFSANAALEDETTQTDSLPKDLKVAWLMLPVALLISVGFFFLTPLVVAKLFGLGGAALAIVEGIIRLVLFIAYVGGISLLPDMRRVFEYHGAEHMTIAAHEHGQPLGIPEIRLYPKEHPRCGTAFLLTVVVVAVVIFSLFGILDPNLPVLILSRVVFLPLIAAVSYEIIRFNAAHEKSLIGKIGMAPGLWLQYLTTRKPDDRQIEVAVAAMNTALEADGLRTALPSATPQVS